MKNIAVIPARGGSKRLPNKNVLLLDGIPLVVHSILYAQKNSSIIDDVIVSTDDAEIKKIALRYGAKVIDRPEEISGDFEPTVTALEHVLKNCNEPIENVILLQPTNPIRPEMLLQDAFQKFTESKSDSLFTVSQSYHKLGKIVEGKFIPYNYSIGQRSQDLEPLYYENGLLYISKKDLIMNKKIISDAAVPYIINGSFPIVDIDNKEDFDYAEYLVKNFKNE